MENMVITHSEIYLFPDGSVISREYGKTPNGNRLNGKWVYRDSFGNFLDFDTYRSDLFERNNLSKYDKE